MVKDKFLLEDYKPIRPTNINGIKSDDKNPLKSIGKGTITIYGKDRPLVLKDVLYVPGLSRNLCLTYSLL